MTGLLEELPAVWAGMWLDAVVAQDVRDQVVLGRVGFITHAALPALQTVPHVDTVRLVNLDVNVQSVDSASTVPTRGLRMRRRLVLPSSPAVCPHHALAVVLVLGPHAHFGRIIASHFAGLEVAADSFLLLCGFHHCVPLVLDILFILSSTPNVCPHGALALQPSVNLLRSSMGHLGGGRVAMSVDLRLATRFTFALNTVLVGGPQRGWIDLHQATSGGHIVQHVDTRGHSSGHAFPFHMR